MSLAAAIQIQDQDIYNQSSVKNAEYLGQVAQTADGRFFAYAQNGASALTAGQITQPAAVTANYATRTLSVAQPVGSEQVIVTLGTTATQDQFVGFYLVVTDGTGAGQGTFPVLGNTAATAGNSNTTVVTLAEGVRVALDNTSVVGLYPSQQSAVVTHTAAVAVPTSGAPVINVAAGNYFWNQVQGYASILQETTGVPTKNALAVPGGTTPGSVALAATTLVTEAVGYAPELAVASKYSPIVLTLLGV